MKNIYIIFLSGSTGDTAVNSDERNRMVRQRILPPSRICRRQMRASPHRQRERCQDQNKNKKIQKAANAQRPTNTTDWTPLRGWWNNRKTIAKQDARKTYPAAAATARGITARVRRRFVDPGHLRADSCRAARKRAWAEWRAERQGFKREDSTTVLIA